MLFEQRAQIDVEQLVPVQRIDVSLLRSSGGGETNSASSTERLGLLDGNDLRAEPVQLP